MIDYSEKQVISDIGIRFLFFISSLITIIVTIYSIVSERKAGEDITELIWIMVLIIGIQAGVYFLVFISPLQIRVSAEGIHYKYVPFIWKERTLAYVFITGWKMRRISPFREFGGWGYRKKSGKKTTGLVLKDGNGFEIQKTDGSKIVMTSANAEMMAIALRNYIAEKEIK